MNQNKRKLVFILAMLVASSMTLAGCSNVNSKDAHPLPSPTQIKTVQPTITPLEQSSAEPSIPVAATDGDTVETVDSETLNDTQLNSINMLNYLVMLTQEINAATNSRLYLEEAYSSLINNTLPEAVDNRTLVEINLQRIDGILHENGEPIFLIEPINAQYSMKSDPDIDSLKECIVFDGTLLSIPVQLVSEQYSIEVSVTTDGETIAYDDWTLEKVERKDKSDITSFVAHFSSKAIKKHKFAVGARISVKIQPDTEYSTSMICCDYNAVAGKTLMVFDKTEIQRAE